MKTLLIAGFGDIARRAAPPPATGTADTRTRNLLAALAKGGILPARVVYVSTSGVYGDCGGARVDESRAVQPQTDRARRRVDAERQLALWCSARRESQGRIAPELLSFMGESRRLANRRMKEGLGVRLRYRTVFEGVPRPGEAA